MVWVVVVAVIGLCCICIAFADSIKQKLRKLRDSVVRWFRTKESDAADYALNKLEDGERRARDALSSPKPKG